MIPLSFLGCTVLAILIYLPSTKPAFQFDDVLALRSIIKSAAGGWWVLITHIYAQPHGGRWSPFFDSFLYINWLVFKTSAIGYHIVDSVLHGISAAFLGLTVFTISGRVVASAMAAGLMLVQPFPQSVAWITAGHLNELSGTLYLAALYAFVRMRRGEHRSAWHGAAALIAWGLSLATYEVALTAPMTIVVYDFLFEWPRWGQRERLWRTGGACVVVGAIAVAYMVIRHHLIGHWVGSYGPSTILNFHHVLPNLTRVAQVFLEPLNAAVLHAPQAHITLALYRIGLAGIVLVVLLLGRRSMLRPALFGLAFAGIVLLPVVGIVAIHPDLTSSRYLYLPAAGLAIAAVGVLDAAPLVWLRVPVYTCVWVGLLGALLLNEQPWAVAQAMVVDTVNASRYQPIQVFGVPLYAYDGAYTFGFMKNVMAYPGGNGRNIAFDNPVIPGRLLLYWEGRRLAPIPGSPLRAWSGAKLAGWTWGDQAKMETSGSALILHSNGGDPLALSPALNLTGPRARIVIIEMDAQDMPCHRGQIIWRTSRGDFLVYFSTKPQSDTEGSRPISAAQRMQRYVVLAPPAVGDTVVKALRIDPLLCPGQVTIRSISIGGAPRSK